MLSIALAHLEAKVPEYPAALVALLDAWRAERTPRIADLLDRALELSCRALAESLPAYFDP
ncbi:MAG: hypothetical protein JNL79_05990 [Myxococcales bacterium]|nr:hypothetical protein [Myxococcales bacterium]